MCGRFALATSPARIARRLLGATAGTEADTPRYNIAPGTPIAILRARPEAPGAARLDTARWGFRPHWAGEDAPRPINARAEKAATAPYFSDAFAHRRCLVPASGWYEWQQQGQAKQPYYITLADPAAEEALLLAGLWDRDGPSGEPCCAILTEPAGDGLERIHPRRPVALDPACRWAWLDPQRTGREAVRRAARRLEPGRLTWWPVSARVNRPEHDDAQLLERQPGEPGRG